MGLAKVRLSPRWCPEITYWLFLRKPGQFKIVLSPAPWGFGRIGGGAPESNQVPPNTIEFVEGRTVSLPNTVPGMQWVLNNDTCNLLCFQHCYKSFINVNLFNSVINPETQVLLLSPGGKAPCLRQPSQQEVQVGFELGKSGSIRLSHKPIRVC